LCLGANVHPAKNSIDLILEYVDGSSLDDAMNGTTQGFFTVHDGGGKKMSVMLKVAECLRYLHERTPRVVHGDLKPSNIMIVTPTGCPKCTACRAATPQVKLLDFGLSRLLKGHVQILGGTPAWSAPEVLGEEPGSVDPAADIYSLGLLIYFVMTGEQPVVERSGSGWSRLPLAWSRDTAGKITKAAVHDMLRERVEDRLIAAEAHAEVRQAIETLRSMESREALGTPTNLDSLTFPESIGKRKLHSSELAVPHLVETPNTTVWRRILDLVLSVNWTMSTKACCSYHAAMAALRSECKVLMRSPCWEIDFQSEYYKSCVQCGGCFGLHLKSTETLNPIVPCKECCNRAAPTNKFTVL